MKADPFLSFRLVRLTVLATVCCGLAMSSSAQAGVDVKINSDPPAANPPPGDVQNEIRIAVDPSNSNNLVTAYNDRSGVSPNPLGVSFSTNGGATWTDRQLSVPADPFGPPGSMLDDIFDPFLSHDGMGNIYAGYVARPSTGGGGSAPPSGVFIELSTDGGNTWSGPTTIASDPGGAGPTSRFNDRPSMDTDANGNVVVTWIKDTGFGTNTSDIYYAESMLPGPPMPPMNPTGLMFSAPVTVNDTPNGLPDPMTMVTDKSLAPDIALTAGGQVYIAWSDYDPTTINEPMGSIKFNSTTFGNPGGFSINDVTVANINPLPDHITTASGATDARAQSYPSIAVDPTDGTGQTVYLTYASEGATGDEGDIYFTRTTTGGGSSAAWSTPFTINDDGTLTDQMHPNISVKPDGTIDIVWYDKRNSVADADPTNDDAIWDVYITRSTDGGQTFSPNLRVSDVSFATPDNANLTEKWMGEYLGIDTDSTDAFIAFTSGSTDSFGDVFFDRIPNSAIPEPNSSVLLIVGSLALIGRRH